MPRFLMDNREELKALVSAAMFEKVLGLSMKWDFKDMNPSSAVSTLISKHRFDTKIKHKTINLRDTGD